MKELIPKELYNLALKLESPLYVVGGICRDYLSGLVPARRDWDICAAIGAEALKSAAVEAGFTVTAVYANTGTVRLSAGGEDYEYTCFRTDRYTRGVHSPEEVYFTEDINLDARRRDFKCNAVYYDIRADKFVDPLGGTEDIKNKIVNTVVDANKVFGEDGLRLMRLARISAQIGFTPSEECIDGAAANSHLIDDIAVERVWTELSAILNADNKYGISGGQFEGLRLLHRIGVLKRILPELALGDGMEQNEYHKYDVLGHSLRCVYYAPPHIRFAALLHDIGKPYCKINTGKFHRHEEEGERIAEEVCARLRVPKKLTERTCALVRWHMYDLLGDTSEKKLKKFLVTHIDILDDLLALKQADFSACKDDTSVAPCVVRWSAVFDDMKKDGVPLSVKELAVRGDELIKEGVPPALTGKTLFYLLKECAAGNIQNDRVKLLKQAVCFIKNLD